jgi:hypothetical protein
MASVVNMTVQLCNSTASQGTDGEFPPTELLKRVLEQSKLEHRLPVALGTSEKDTYPPHARRLLGLRDYRQHSRAAEERDKIAPSHLAILRAEPRAVLETSTLRRGGQSETAHNLIRRRSCPMSVLGQKLP